MAPNLHLQIAPRRDAITETSARLSTLEQDDTSGYVVTIDFTDGLESGLDEFMERLEDPDSITLESLTLPEEDVLALFDDNAFSESPGLENLTLRDVSLLGPGQTHATADATRVPLLEPLRLRLPNKNIDLRRSFSGEDGGEPGSLELYPEENMVVMTCYDAMSEARRTLWPDE